MATPTIASVTPNTGSTIGTVVVEILGTGFRLPTPPPESSRGPLPDPAPSVVVTFGGVEADRVRVISSGRILVSLPAHAKGLVDVVVTNVDDFGAPLESGTLEDGFTYSLPALTGESRLNAVVRALIRSFKTWVLDEVIFTQHVDWDDDPMEALRKLATAKVPAIFLTGPSLRASSGEQQDNDIPYEDFGDGTTAEFRTATLYDLQFGLTCVSDSTRQMLELLNATIVAVARAQKLTVTYGGAVVQYDMFLTDPQADARPSSASIYTTSKSLTIVAVPLFDLPDVDGDGSLTWHPTLTSAPSTST